MGVTETRYMRLRGFEYRTAFLWDDDEHAECRFPMREGWLDLSHAYDDLYRVTIEYVGNDRAERMARLEEERKGREEAR